MFQPFGDLKEVHIIRGTEGSPKGCAFVKFVSKEAAIMAIDNLNETVPPVRSLLLSFEVGCNFLLLGCYASIGSEVCGPQESI